MLTIGKLGESACVKGPTIRYYEQIGLLPEPERSAGNQRLYGAKALDRLAFIRHARDLGFPLEAIRDLLSLSDRPDQSCAAADIIATEQLATVRSEEHTSELQSLMRISYAVFCLKKKKQAHTTILITAKNQKQNN